MNKVVETKKKQDIELLNKFKEAVRTWSHTYSETYRSEINRMLPQARKLINLTGACKLMTLSAPLALGGQKVMEDVDALDLIFDCPFNIDASPYVIDECDMAIGVLSDDNFDYTDKSEKIENMRKFNEDDVDLFESLINQGENILSRYANEEEEALVNNKEFNLEYDQWRAEVFRLFETHFDLKNDIVFNEIGMNQILIFKKRGASYVEIILRALKACYRIPYHQSKMDKTSNNNLTPMKQETSQPININIHNENKQNQNQNQSQELHLLVDLLKDSLAPFQIKELKEVAQADCPEPEKRQNLINKILSFGSNVGASVLANILMSPQVIGLL